MPTPRQSGPDQTQPKLEDEEEAAQNYGGHEPKTGTAHHRHTEGDRQPEDQQPDQRLQAPELDNSGIKRLHPAILSTRFPSGSRFLILRA